MAEDLNQLNIFVNLIGGVALFLFGMDIMTRALKQVAGASMKAILTQVTSNRFRGLLAGASITAVIQSSSITSVLLVGFVSAGLMTTAQSVAMILGANIGTTITAQILAFKVTAFALPIFAVGFFVSALAKQKATREYGRILLGIGMVFFGMAIMSEAMRPLRSYQPFLDFMLNLDHVLLAAMVGAGFTALVQSSSATTGILIVLAGQGLIGLEAAVAIALGANVGTCVTALLAAVGRPNEALRTAMVHTLFNVVGVLIWIGFVDHLASLARAVSSPLIEDGASTVPRQLANVHTFFNIVNALLFIGFTKQIAQFVEWLIPDRPEALEPKFAPKHLDPKFLEVPAIALDAARLEVLQLGQLVRDMLGAAIPTVTSGSPLDIDRLKVMDRPVDLLHREIVGYMRQISLASLPTDQARQLMELLRIANDLEHIGDHVATGLVTSARKRIDENVVISPATASVLEGLHSEVMVALNGVLIALEDQDASAAVTVREMKSRFVALVEEIAGHEIERLRADEPKRLHTYAREIELTETLEDIFKILRRISRSEIAIFQ
ncbi:Na/Pi cotransporter family protein [Aliiroseovarius sp. KMU-50]|uniref:Na/Pi cotransporter family protein n=1 Tax=Aliiroseovarius salicola TaxID=3009082 RepID=A0ABT4W5L9_9RHOB|nr:Na/Pi cotransporter family protein [Aliiroseovarius sp. KMU-50]MDA5095801.1 Na/Pi cotransporter family protein [Aliiroseovarius sp. KMU-50]